MGTQDQIISTGKLLDFNRVTPDYTSCPVALDYIYQMKNGKKKSLVFPQLLSDFKQHVQSE